MQNTGIPLFKRDFNILYFPVNKQTLVHGSDISNTEKKLSILGKRGASESEKFLYSLVKSIIFFESHSFLSIQWAS